MSQHLRAMTERTELPMREIWYTRSLCALTLLLIACTWRLWSGQNVFPQVPLISAAVAWPRWIDNVVGMLLAAALLSAIVGAAISHVRRLSLGVTIVCLLMLWTTDQHRLQPWAYHFFLAAWILVFLPPSTRLRWLRLLMVSVYLYSAFSKLDARFLQTHGALFLGTGLKLLGGKEPASVDTLARWAVFLPMGELLAGILLAVPRLRRVGLLAAAALHLTLFVLLGPWGLNHRWGVLVWNLSFLVQAIVLFSGTSTSRAADQPIGCWWDSTSTKSQLATIPVLAALLMPLFEPFGLWDAWLSWGLYSMRAAKLELYLATDTVSQLPPDIRAYCDRTRPESPWVHLAIDRWSLDTLQAPLYPHARFELGVVLAVLDQLPTGRREVRVVGSGPPNRRTGQAAETRWDGEQSIRQLALRYRWNCLPRE